MKDWCHWLELTAPLSRAQHSCLNRRGNVADIARRTDCSTQGETLNW